MCTPAERGRHLAITRAHQPSPIADANQRAWDRWCWPEEGLEVQSADWKRAARPRSGTAISKQAVLACTVKHITLGGGGRLSSCYRDSWKLQNTSLERSGSLARMGWICALHATGLEYPTSYCECWVTHMIIGSLFKFSRHAIWFNQIFISQKCSYILLQVFYERITRLKLDLWRISLQSKEAKGYIKSTCKVFIGKALLNWCVLHIIGLTTQYMQDCRYVCNMCM